MFDRLEDLARSLEEINMQLTDPDVINDQNKYRQLMKEQSELTPIVEKYQEYRAAKDGIEESLQLLEEENDEEMRELAKEELSECRATVEKCEQELALLFKAKIGCTPEAKGVPMGELPRSVKKTKRIFDSRY